MADKNQLKIADPVDLADDDPFAELTRIMGFDPRQPARPAAAEPAAAVQQAEADEDDFSLDLEKELLGGFEIEEEHLSLESQPAEAQATADEPVVAEVAEPELAEPGLAEVDFDFSGTFDEAMAVPDIQEPADRPVSEASPSEEPEAQDVDFDFGSDFDAAMAAPESFEIPAAEPEPDFDGDLDAAFAAAADEGAADEEAEFDLGLTDEDVRALDVIPSPPALPVTPEAVARDAEIDSDLDAAMVDLDFLADAEAPSAEPVEAAAQDEVPSAVAEDDLHLFDEIDFQLDDEPAAAFTAAAEEAAADEEADLDFLADAEAPSAEPIEAAAQDEVPSAVAEDDLHLFDEIDFQLDDEPAAAFAAAAEEAAADEEAELDFLADAQAPSAEPVEAVAQDESPAAVAEDDLHLFDEIDFHLEDDEPASAEPAPQAEAAAEIQPEIDETAFGFDEDELRLDDAFAAEEPAAEQEDDGQRPADEIVFDEADFAGDLDDVEPARDEVAVAAEAPVEQPPVVAESGVAGGADPLSASTFEFSVPSYVSRKLPTSPMDVAAEEYRQREAASAPAEPAFNLEDELNALLGNLKSGTTPAEQAKPAAIAPEMEPQRPPAHTPTSSIFGSASQEAYPQPSRVAPEPVGFDAPEHPADIDDELNWELDEAFSVAEPDPAYEEPADSYADDERDGPLEDDGFETLGEEEPDGVFAESFATDEDQAAADLDEVFDELAEDPLSSTPTPSYGDAVAGVAAGAAAARFGSAFASAPFASDSAARAAGTPGVSGGHAPERFSPHRDPVVRGDPMKEDPLDIITQLAEKYSRKEPETPYGRAMSIATGAAPATAYDEAGEDDGDIDISDAFEEPPEVETIEVGDHAIALADDLDIPELPEDEDLPPVAAYDDLDTEFSSLLSDMNAETQDTETGNGHDDRLAGDFTARPYESQFLSASYGTSPARPYEGDLEQDSFAFDAAELRGSRTSSGGHYAVEAYQFDPEADEEIAPSHLAAESRKPVSRGLLVAGVIGGVALVGAIGGLVLSFGGGGDDAPAIVRADGDPVKVRPETPGGATVPNQDSKVYETVAGEGAADRPQQEKLVTTTEEPIDVTPPAVEDEDVATAFGKSEDRIEQILQDAENQTDAEIVAVAPRKVRTMVVKPDGTLVPREDEPETAFGDPTETVAAAIPRAAPAPVIPESTGALPATIQANPPALAPAAEEPVAPQEAATAPEAESDIAISMPDTVPIAPMRPADQPVDVVGEVKPDQVAAAAATAAAGGGWAMQIASQPSEAAAQSSYQDLARRYGGVLQGRQVNIVKAEIPGKGTFWRVRVPAESRNEAISLCENYKAAGGNCFVSR